MSGQLPASQNVVLTCSGIVRHGASAENAKSEKTHGGAKTQRSGNDSKRGKTGVYTLSLTAIIIEVIVSRTERPLFEDLRANRRFRKLPSVLPRNYGNYGKG